MLNIRVHNEYLDLDEEVKLPYEFNKDILDFEVFKDSRILSFSIPYTPKNYRLLKFNYDVLLYPAYKVDCSIYFRNSLIARGKIIPGEFESKISIKIEFDLIGIYETGVQTSIDELLPNYSSSFTGNGLADDRFKLFPQANYCAPTMSYPYTDLSGIDTLNFLGTYSPIEGVTLYSYFDYNETGYSSKMFMPYFYVGFVVESIFKHFGYKVGSSVFETLNHLRRAFIIFNYPAKTWSNYTTMTFADRLPNITVSDFLKQVTKLFNLDFALNSGNNTVNIQLKSTINQHKKGYYSLSNLAITTADKTENIGDVTISNTITSESLTDSNIGDISKLIEYSYDYYNLRDGGYRLITENVTASQYFRYLILGFYEMNTIPDVINEIDGVSLILDSNHIYFHSTKKSITLKNRTLELATADLTVDAKFVSKINDIGYIIHDYSKYLIYKMTGYLTGSDYSIFKAYLIKL